MRRLVPFRTEQGVHDGLEERRFPRAGRTHDSRKPPIVRKRNGGGRPVGPQPVTVSSRGRIRAFWAGLELLAAAWRHTEILASSGGAKHGLERGNRSAGKIGLVTVRCCLP